MVAVNVLQDFRDIPRNPAASQIGTRRCISQVAAVWRNVESGESVIASAHGA